jgi:hypothetical protein
MAIRADIVQPIPAGPASSSRLGRGISTPAGPVASRPGQADTLSSRPGQQAANPGGGPPGPPSPAGPLAARPGWTDASAGLPGRFRPGWALSRRPGWALLATRAPAGLSWPPAP